MNLERVEERCLNYLRQAKNPLVPLSILLQHCQQEDALAELEQDTLYTFLRDHPDVQLVAGVANDNDVSADAFAAIGIDMGARAILTKRIPTPNEMFAMVHEQLSDMHQALVRALENLKVEDGAKKEKLEQTLQRLESLRKKLGKLDNSSTSE